LKLEKLEKLQNTPLFIMDFIKPIPIGVKKCKIGKVIILVGSKKVWVLTLLSEMCFEL
jgi:hypothetical protein